MKILTSHTAFNSRKLVGHDSDVIKKYSLITVLTYIIDYAIIWGLDNVGVSPYIESMTNSLVQPLAVRPNLVVPLGRLISISLPPGLELTPGEPVDVTLLKEER